MAFGTQDEPDDVMNEINMTPLVDVMLVLLIIFIITVPVMKRAVNIDLPRETTHREETKPETISLSVAADGAYWWHQEKIDDATLESRLAEAGQHDPTPELHIRADKEVRYERVAGAIAAATRGGVSKIGFITDPKTE